MQLFNPLTKITYSIIKSYFKSKLSNNLIKNPKLQPTRSIILLNQNIPTFHVPNPKENEEKGIEPT